jgi:transposase-like protein
VERWVKQYGRFGYRSKLMHVQTVEDEVEVKAMKKRMAELESALAESTLENRMLKTTLEVASQALELDLKKLSGRNHKPSY